MPAVFFETFRFSRSRHREATVAMQAATPGAAYCAIMFDVRYGQYLLKAAISGLV